MTVEADNPFRLAKSLDLSDEQVERYWVDFEKTHGPAAAGFDPAALTPTIILGGKGSGKSHLLRYHSFNLQAIRHRRFEDWTEVLKKDGYIGIYTLAGGLNARRFAGKGISEEQWMVVFSYYMELWFLQEMTAVLKVLLPHLPELKEREELVVRSLRGCFDDQTDLRGATDLHQFETVVRDAQRELDRQINDATFTHELHPKISASQGALIFGVPRALARELGCFKDIVFAYYVDEFENLEEQQQRYVNTLVRERQAPVTFRIGARAYGMRTYGTFSAAEPIRAGSEFEYLRLDARFRRYPRRYSQFARTLVRLRVEDVAASIGSSSALDGFFGEPAEHWGSRQFLEMVGGIESGSARPHFRRLSRQLDDYLAEAEGPRILENLSCPEFPLLEKVSIYSLYKAWAERRDLYEASRAARAQREAFLNGDRRCSFFQDLSHFKSDLIAQLRRAADRPQVYAGLNTFISMSEGLPRALLTVLKDVYSWASFRGERPFQGGVISIDSQRRGVREASGWFLDEMPEVGAEGIAIRSAINRLAEYFRTNRYSDKPVECSLIAFSVDMSAISASARDTIERAESRSLLIKIEAGERDRSSKKVKAKYQLSSMVCPFYDLPLGRRGTARLNPLDVNVIFEIEREADFDEWLRDWRSRLNAPFSKAHKRRRRSPNHGQSQGYSDRPHVV